MTSPWCYYDADIEVTSGPVVQVGDPYPISTCYPADTAPSSVLNAIARLNGPGTQVTVSCVARATTTPDSAKLSFETRFPAAV